MVNAPTNVGVAFQPVDSNDLSAGVGVTLTWSPPNEAPPYALVIQRWDSINKTWATAAMVTDNLRGYYWQENLSLLNAKFKYRMQTVASNGSTSAWTEATTAAYTTPSAPTGVVARYTSPTSITVTWTNTTTYTEAENWLVVSNQGEATSLPTLTRLSASTTQYTFTGVDPTKVYQFNLQSAFIDPIGVNGGVSMPSNPSYVKAVTSPGTPVLTAPAYADFVKAPPVISWAHTASGDGSLQTKYRIRYRLSGASTWTEGGITSTTSSTAPVWPANAFSNGQSVEVQVQTWGVATNPGPYSATSVITGHTTPVVTITSPVGTLGTAQIVIAWLLQQEQNATQVAYSYTVTNTGDGTVLNSGTGTTGQTVTVPTPAANHSTYRIDLSATDSVGMQSAVVSRTISVEFLPPAEAQMVATYDADSGSIVLNVSPTQEVNGQTLAIERVDVERRVYDPELDALGDWEPVATGVSPSAVLVDTTAPIYGDGEYRVTSWSSINSVMVPIKTVVPTVIESDWAFLSAGPKFNIVARFWANIEISWKSSRSKALHYFAGRKRPVIYSGESAEKVLTVSGLVTDDASSPARWLYVAQQEGPVMFRAPGNRRIYGSLSEVQVDRISPTLNKVSFSIQEVYKPTADGDFAHETLGDFKHETVGDFTDGGAE